MRSKGFLSGFGTFFLSYLKFGEKRAIMLYRGKKNLLRATRK
jgi:hypothetical protein